MLVKEDIEMDDEMSMDENAIEYDQDKTVECDNETASWLDEKEELENRLLRLQADFENYKKRMQKEKSALIQYANESLILDFLEILDNFDRAIDAMQDQKEVRTVINGVQLVQKQFHDTLEKKGAKPMVSIGELFDPNFHEALGVFQTDEESEDTIVEEFQKGYILNDKVIRHAKVKIARPFQKEEIDHE